MNGADNSTLKTGLLDQGFYKHQLQIAETVNFQWDNDDLHKLRNAL